MALTVKIRGDASQFEKTMRGVNRSVSNVGAKIAGIGAAGLAAAGAYVSLGQAMEFLTSSSQAASNIESLTMQFETLLGSASAAEKRMKEIAKFAASTPFEIAELSATSKQLQNAGGDFLAIGDGLRMVGDAAAISGRPLEEVALHIGRVFGAMTSGTSAGESVGRLVEIGLITGDVKREFEALAIAQKKGAAATLTGEQALAKMQSVLSKTEGAMARLANTTEGKLSNMKDNISQLKVAFGTGFNEGLKDALDAANVGLPKLEQRFADAGTFVGQALTDSLTGDMKKFQLIGNLIGAVLAEGVKTGFEKLIMGTIENVMVDYAEWFQQNQRRSNMETKNQLMDKALQETDPAKREKLLQAAQGIGDFSTIREKYNLGDDYSKKSSNFMSGIRSQLNDVNLEMEIQKGIKTGIDMSMSQAVREGVLEAMQKQPTGAKFSN